MPKASFYSPAVICVVAMIVAAGSSGKTAGNDEGRTYKFDVSSGQTIQFDFKSGGSANLVGWDKPEAQVTYSQTGSGPKHNIQILQQGGGLLITSDSELHEGGSRNLEFQVRLPSRSNVSFESAGGNLQIMGLEGDITGNTMGGALNLSNVNGTITFKTMGGQIDVISSALDGSVITMGGTVYLKDVTGDLDAKSMGGNVRFENVRGRDGKLRAPGGVSGGGLAQETVTISTMGGDIDVDVAPVGALLNTMGGDIVVESASGFVKAETMGGNIDLHVVDGSIDATTMAGKINVEVEKGLGDSKDGVKLSSCCGDIDLTVPADLSMSLDLTIKYTKNSSQDFEIKSDFPVQIERSQDWDYSNGSPRKRIRATGQVAGGKYPIVIETINGDVRVMKAK